MKIKWYGHAAFLITSEQGTRIITDPYEPGAFGGQLSYGKIQDQAEIVLVSHDHADHNHTADLPGKPQIVKGGGSRSVKGIAIRGVNTYHDGSRGSERGNNTVFNLNVDGIQVCHLGDLGHVLSPQEVSEIGPVDILISPVGGFYTINAKEATQVADLLKPNVVIPMHFKTGKCGFPIAPVEEFLNQNPIVNRTGLTEVSFEKRSLPPEREVVVLDHAL